MNITFTVKRYWLDLKRFRTFSFLIAITFAIGMALFFVIYPGPEFFDALLEIPIFQVLVGEIGEADSGLLLWILMLLSILLNIIYPVIGILFGTRILPFNEKDGKELIFSTEKSPLMYFLENLLLILILIPLVLSPAYLVGVVGFLSSDPSSVWSFTIAFIQPLFFAFVVAMVSSLGCAIWSSTRTGYAFGGIFFLLSFTLDILQQEIDIVKDLNLMTQSSAFLHAIEKTWNEEFILKCLFLMVLLISLIIFFLYRTDYIETRSSYSKPVEKEETRGLMAKFVFIRTPVESILSRVGWKNPAFRDQLQSSAGLFLIYLVVTCGLLLLVALVYPGDAAMASVFSGLDVVFESPIIAAFLFGHQLTPTLEGFLLYKIMAFHWIYYGPFLFIATQSIIMRDKNDGYDEITWSMPRTRTKVVMERTMAALVYFWIIIIANFMVLYSGEIILNTYADIVMTDFGATVLTFFFLGLGYSLFLVLFVALASIPRPKYISPTLLGTFLLAIFIPLVWILNQDLSWLLYLTPFYYFDVAGIFLNDILFEKVIPETFIYGVVTIAFFVSILKFWTPRKDIA